MPGPGAAQSGEIGAQRAVWLVLAAVSIFAVFVVVGWSSSPLSGRLNPAVHVENKVKSELDLRFRQGVEMLNAKQYERALTEFHRVLELSPKMPEAHVNAGYALLGMKNYKAAADFFDTATTLRPDQLNAYFGLGEALQEMGDKEGALQAMETYLHRSPASDPFRRKAESAAWELRAELHREIPANPSGNAPHRSQSKVDGKP